MINLESIISLKEKKSFSIKGIEVLLKDPINKSISLKRVIKKAFRKVPEIFWQDLRSIKVGQFEELVDRNLQAMYKDQEIYLNSEVSKEEDFIDDIIHELAHHVEEKYNQLIYGDGLVEKEFKQKRQAIFTRLKTKGFNVDLNIFLNVKYNKDFDFFMSSTVGYPTLRTISSDIFFSPYAVTSLREYYANAFEAYYMKEELYRLKKISPILYNKIINLGELENE